MTPFQDNPGNGDDQDDRFQENPNDQDDHDDPFQDDQDCLSESWHCRLGNGQMGPWGSLLLSTIISTLSKTRKRQIHTLAMTYNYYYKYMLKRFANKRSLYKFVNFGSPPYCTI